MYLTDISSSCYEFLRNTLKRNPAERPTLKQLFEMPFIKTPPRDRHAVSRARGRLIPGIYCI